MSHLTSLRQKYDETIADYIRRFRDKKNLCYSLVISKRDLAELAFNGLRFHIRERLEGHEFANITQVLQRTLAQESRSKDTRLKSNRSNMRMLNYESSDDESKDVYTVEFVWSPQDTPSNCVSLKPAHKNRQDEVKFTFNVSKCDRIFDELVKAGKIKFSHIYLQLMN